MALGKGLVLRSCSCLAGKTNYPSSEATLFPQRSVYSDPFTEDQMKPIRTFKVRPCLPEPLLPLLQIAHNLRWSWDHGAIQLFLRLDRDLWESCGHNPVLFVGSVDQRTLDKAAGDDSFLAHMAGVAKALQRYLSGEGSWWREHGKEELQVAYFSAEFGITECLSIFAGGLGVLAGDHLKAASDLGVPLVGVGLLYRRLAEGSVRRK
jgi:starch phosphorylase